jgi:putative acetyltransferase
MRPHLKVRPADLTERTKLEELQLRSSLAVAEDAEVAARMHSRPIAIGGGAIEEGRVRLLERDGELLGFSEWSRTSRREWELESLFVDRGAMRAGHGTRLLTDLIELARHQGVRRISVTANPEAVPFYEARGFERLGEVRTEFGPAMRMQLDFTHA